MDAHLRNLLEELTRSLCDAIADSEEVSDQLDRIRTEGYSLNLFLDCTRLEDEEDESDGEPATETVRAAADLRAELEPAAALKPSFRINGDDLAFLRSVGIDPTRRVKNRRRRPESSTDEAQ